MSVSRQIWNLGLILTIGSLGCAHLMETKTIEKFTANLEKKDLEGLKATASDDFAGRALRTADAIKDLEILRIPSNGKISVVKVEDVSKTHKRVTVEVGEAKKEVFYELTKSSSGRWVVDDIYLRQKKQGVEAYKAVSEQMDLLITVREFLEACDVGDRDDVLRGVTPPLRSALEKLPPEHLARMTQLITRGRRGAKSQKPQAQLTDDVAVVRFPRSTGELQLVLELADGEWRVEDVLVESKEEGERLPSLYREALAVALCLDFLAAYERCDRSALAKLCSADFYEGSLSLGNLKEVQLPSALLTDHELKASSHGPRADFTLKNDREIVQITLHRQQLDELEETPTFHVTNVSIFDIGSQQQKRLGALFTARAMGEFYLQALAERDVTKLRHSSTKDFTGRVWKRLNEATITTMPLEPFDGTPATLSQIQFDGDLVRIAALAGSEPVELMLREEAGRFLVDDILWKLPGRPDTAKATLELVIPVRNFAQGIALGRDPQRQRSALDILEEASSRDFNRMVWRQTEFVPNSGLSADTFLNAPLKSLTQADGKVIIQFGDPQFGAVVTMVKEQDLHAIDEILLIAGPQPENRLTMKQELRTQLSRGLAQPPDGIQLASQARVHEKPNAQVVHADFADPPPAASRGQAPRELKEPENTIPLESWDDLGEVQTEPGAN